MAKCCNFCKYFINDTSSSKYSLFNDMIDYFGIGVCALDSTSHSFYDQTDCSTYEYYPLRNSFGVESDEYFEEWLEARKIRAELWDDILEWKAKNSFGVPTLTRYKYSCRKNANKTYDGIPF